LHKFRNMPNEKRLNLVGSTVEENERSYTNRSKLRMNIKSKKDEELLEIGLVTFSLFRPSCYNDVKTSKFYGICMKWSELDELKVKSIRQVKRSVVLLSLYAGFEERES